MQCRQGCAACCIEPSINTAIPNMPNGKPAGVMCVNLNPETLACEIWQQSDYPPLCRDFKAEVSVCGDSRDEALHIIRLLENDTKPRSL